MVTRDAERPAGFRELLADGRAPLVMGLLGATLLASLDYLLALTVLPVAAKDVGGVDRYALAVGLYTASMTAGLPAGGALVDRHGPRRVLLIGSLLFGTAAFAAGAAPSMLAIAAARAVQGLGTGLLLAVPVSAIMLYLPPRVHRQAFAMNALVWSVSSVLGPAAGSALTSLASWRWAFWATLPALALVVLVAAPALRGARPETPPASVDLVGPALLGALVAAALLEPLAALPVAGVLVLQQRRSAHRLLPADPLARRVLLASATAGVGFFTCEGLISLVVQRGLGWPQGAAGALFVLSAGLWSAGTVGSARLRTPPGLQVRVGLVLVAAGAGVMALPGGAPTLVAGFGLGAFGMGITSPALFLAMAPRAAHGAGGRAAASIPLSRSLGGGLGIAIGGAIFAHVVGARALDAADRLSHVPELLAGGRAAFAFAAVVALAGCLAVGRLDR